MGTEFSTNMINSFMSATVKTGIWIIAFGAIALISKFIISFVPEKYRDGKIAPENNSDENEYINELNKEMEEAGVDNLRDLESYRENKKL